MEKISREERFVHDLFLDYIDKFRSNVFDGAFYMALK